MPASWFSWPRSARADAAATRPAGAPLGRGAESQGLEAADRARTPLRRRDREAFLLEPASPDYWLRIRRWAEAQEKVYTVFPDDSEAAVFYALSFLATAPSNSERFGAPTGLQPGARRRRNLRPRLHNEPAFALAPVQLYDKNLTYRTGRCLARAYMDRLLPLAGRPTSRA